MGSVVAWVLVAILVDDGKIGVSLNENLFSQMSECFEYREKTIAQFKEWPTPNLQLVCVPADAKGLGGYAL